MSPPKRRRTDESPESLADRLAAALAAHPEGLSASEITKKVFGGNVSKDRVSAAVDLLLRRGLAARGERERSLTRRVPVLRAATNPNPDENQEPPHE